MIKICRVLLILILLPIILTGCWDSKDINKRSIVQSAGINKVDKQTQFCAEITKLIPQQEGQEDGSEAPNVYTDLSYGKNFEEATIDYLSKRPYPTFLGAVRVIVLGTNLAEDSIEPYLNRVNKFFDYRKTILIVISRERPDEIFNIKVEKDRSIGYLVENTIRSLAEQGLTVYQEVGDLLSYIAMEDVGYLIPYIGLKRGSIKYLGLAIMKNAKLQDIIEAKKCKGLLYLIAKNVRFTEVISGFKDPKNNYSFRVEINNKKINTDYIDGRVQINVNLKLNAYFRYQYYIESLSKGDMKLLEKLLTTQIKKYIQEIFNRSTKEWENDIYHFAKYFRADYPELYRKMNWVEQYPNSKLNLSVDVKILNRFLFDFGAEDPY